MTTMCTPWIKASDIIDLRGADEVEGINETVLASQATAASECLFLLTGQQFPGPCRATIRPAYQRHGWSIPDMTSMYSLMVGSVYLGAGTGYWPWGACADVDHDMCRHTRSVDLGVYPIVTINSVTVSGAPLDPSAYRVDNDRFLVRLDGGHWDMCQPLDAPLGSDRTWAVDVTYGAPIPAAARSAAVSLALEAGKALSGLVSALPQRVTSVNRQNVSWTILDPMQFLTEGRTGLYDVDLFIASVNPGGMRSKPRVLSPDNRRTTRRNGPVTAP